MVLDCGGKMFKGLCRKIRMASLTNRLSPRQLHLHPTLTHIPSHSVDISADRSKVALLLKFFVSLPVIATVPLVFYHCSFLISSSLLSVGRYSRVCSLS